MTLQDLMARLTERDVRLGLCDGELQVSATKGALTDELKHALKALKPELVARLQRDADTRDSGIRATTSRPEDRFEPFPFADLQAAFFMADNPYLEFHVRPHYYCETDCDGLDIERYVAALGKALQRHRGEVVIVTGDARLRLLPQVPPVHCPVNDWRDLDTQEALRRLDAVRQAGMRQQLSLDRWPWFDLQISRWREDGRERTRLHFNHNNFYTDGYGATLLQRDIDRYYEEPDAVLPALELSFRDAVLGLQALAESPAGERARRYWLERLPQLPPPPDLPQTGLDRRCRSRLQRREGYLPATLWEAFKRHAAACGLTPTGAIAGAYAQVLSAWSGSQHFILSNMVTRRLPIHPQVMQVVGNFASLYPLEVDLRGDATFADKALRVQQQMMRDAAHREWGGMQVMQALNRRSGSLGTVPCPFVIGSGLFMEKYKKADFACLETSQTMLDHQFWELEDGRYFYVWDLLEEFFPPGLIDAMWRAFAVLLDRLATDAGAWQQVRLDLAPAAEPKLPATPHSPPPGLLHGGLRQAADARPRKTAVWSPRGSITYAQLEGWSAAIAAQLVAHGVGRGDRVALVMDRGPAIVAAAVGILRSGAAYVPIDPGLPGERLRYMLLDCGARLALASSEYRAHIDWPAEVEVIVADSPTRQRAPTVATAATDLAYVIYTSGSTGRPKGVMIDHRGARNTIVDVNRRFGIGAGDVVFGVSSFGFDLSVYDVFGVLEAGASLVYPDRVAALNPAHWLDLMVVRRVTVWNSAPPLMGLLVETALRRGLTLHDLRLVLLSGDWIPVELPAQIRRIAPQARIVSLGGATEASIWSIYHEIDTVDPAWTRIPYGKPLARQAWHIRDAQNRPVPTWVTGDLCISGVGLAQGYWGDEEKTRASFFIDPVTSTRLYRTGDRGRYLPDGSIEFLGRADTQVKIQGHRIELGEIESVLATCELVQQALVLARPLGGGAMPAQAGPGAKELVACVVPTGAMPDDEGSEQALVERLRAALRTQLPAPMVPSVWLLLERMPLSPNGKVDRVALAQRAAVTSRRKEASSQPVAPRSDLEATLARLWQQVLRRDTISVQDDFFDCGGQSIDAVRYVALVQEALGQALTLGDVWQHRTVEAQAALLSSTAARSTSGNLQRLRQGGHGRPVFMVHPAGGQCTGYHALARRLDRPCLGFVANAEEAARDELASVERIAQRYVAQLRDVQPQGPYTLVGWSSGACIAFAMAHALEGAGETVDPLVLIDCPAPLVHEPLSEQQLLQGFFEDLDLGLPLRDLVPEDGSADERFAEAIERASRLLDRPLERQALWPVYLVFRAVVGAARAYRPAVIEAPLRVLRAAQGEVTEFAGHPQADRADWGWGALTRGTVSARRIAGSHYTLLSEPGVASIADCLNAAIEDALPASA